MTMPSTAATSIGWLLENVAEVVDLPPAMHEAAERQYVRLGKFLANHSSGVAWDVYPQGSFRLGTVVRPLLVDTGFDLDMVCSRDISKESITQAKLKDDVGVALEEYVKDSKDIPGMPISCSPSRRCWTLDYVDGFHMDVLPAVPDQDSRPTGIWLTDKKLTRWQPSDPIAYANWFRSQMATALKRGRIAKAADLRKSIEEVPEWQVKTTLQQLVQVLKVHRDLHFKDDLDDQPTSILITTLAALSYNGADNLFDAILHVVDRMADHIETTPAGPRVCSPVSDENFTDKWREYPLREQKFKAWLKKVGLDLQGAANLNGMDLVTKRLGESLGVERVVKAAELAGMKTRSLGDAAKLAVVGGGALLTLSTAPGASIIPKHGFYGTAKS